MEALGAKFMAHAVMTIAERRALVAERKAIDARWPAPRPRFDNVMKHLLHAIAVAGIDHVGISGDFDGGAASMASTASRTIPRSRPRSSPRASAARMSARCGAATPCGS
jgi:microsomal dipeptidase-like Zn-dependent dipeptidase